MTERKQWFIDRIGKRVYRNKIVCPCVVCKTVYNYGITIADTLSADYMCEIEATSNSEGEPLMYFDTIEQRDAFEEILKDYQIEPDTTISRCIEGLTQKVGLQDASAIHLFQKIVKNYLKLKTIDNEK